MTDINKEDLKGKTILSIDMGVGTITDIEKIREDGDYFYVIDYGKTNTKYYSAIDENKKTRFVTTKDAFDSCLKDLKTKKEKATFASKKERQDYFKSIFSSCSLDMIVSKVLQISSIKDLVPNEKEILKKLINNLELEASLIYKLNSTESSHFIAKYL